MKARQSAATFPNNDLTDMNAGDAATVKNSGYSREFGDDFPGLGALNYDYAGKLPVRGKYPC